MELLDLSFANEIPLWSAFGNISKFDIIKNMYAYTSNDSAQRRIAKMNEIRPNAIDSIGNPHMCRKNFCFYPPELAQNCSLLHEYLEHPTCRNNSLSALTQVTTALHYYATGNINFLLKINNEYLFV